MQHRAPFFLSALLAAVLATAAATAVAQPAPLPEDEPARATALKQLQATRDAERKDIAQQRAAMAKVRAEQESACYQRFAVENCLSKVRATDREQEKTLRARELRINEAERQEKSSERLRSIEKKLSEPRQPPAVLVSPRPPLAQKQEPPKRTSADVERDRAALNQGAAQRAQEQAQAKDAHARQLSERTQADAQRRAEAQAAQRERAEAAARSRERRDEAVKNRTAAPLPVPTAP